MLGFGFSGAESQGSVCQRVIENGNIHVYLVSGYKTISCTDMKHNVEYFCANKTLYTELII
jgi:hypothetical protein